MINNKPYIVYIHTKSEIQDIKNFVDQDGLSIASGFINKESSLMDYDGDTGKTNRQRVFEKYTEEEEEDNKSKPDRELLLKLNTQLLLPKGEKINREMLVSEGNQVVDTNNFTAFLSNQLKAILEDSKYFPVYKHKEVALGTFKKLYPNITVWMWCRSLSPASDELDELQGSFIDISAFVQNLSINNAEGGGNFTLTLSPLICESSEEMGWTIKKSTIANYFANNLKNNYNASSNLHYLDKFKELKRNQFFFHNIINSNDMVFIRFETLESELADRSKEANRFSISKSDIPGKTYDMIGLVDTNSLVLNPASNEINISIVGRDLIKVVIDDGCYFYPLEYAQGMFVENQESDRLISRIFGKIETLGVYIQRSIQFSMRFVINQLANLGIVPQDLFDSYQDRRSTFYRLNEKDEFEEQHMQGVFQIIKLLIDESVANRRIVDSSISTESGSIFNFIQKICQKPFVEFLSDTYGDQFYFIVRQPPFTKDAFKSLIYGTDNTEKNSLDSRSNQTKIDEDTKAPKRNELVIDIEEGDILLEQLDFDDSEVYSWYKLNPQGLFLGSGTDMTLAYLPAIYFSEYANIWGSRPLDIVTNYVPYIPIEGDKRDVSQNYFERQAFRDLKFMIDTHCYLPFTRKGTITINGDRRIKRGTTIRHKGTGEIFYVEGVGNNYQTGNIIDRTTTLSLKRGMVEKYIDGVDGISYFSIINTDLDEEFFVAKKEDGKSKLNTSILKNWRVNKQVFNFFLKRNQFKG